MNTNKKRTPESLNARDWGTWVIIAVVVVAIWALSWYLIDTYVISTKAEQSIEAARGVFGDKFGAINALFSGLAFAGIIFTIFLQRRELSLQRNDIEEQNETLRQQRFENSFFHLLALHGNIVENLEITSQKQRQAVSYFVDLLKFTSPEFSAFHPLSRLSLAQIHELRGTKILTAAMKDFLTPSEIATIEAMLENNPGIIGEYLETSKSFHWDLVNKAYLAAHEKSKDGLSHYFRNLYHVFRFIDESPLIDDEEKRKYARITRAQLSDCELIAILYNSLTGSQTTKGRQLEFGYPKMTRLVQKYEILQNLNHQSVIHPIHLDLIAIPCTVTQ